MVIKEEEEEVATKEEEEVAIKAEEEGMAIKEEEEDGDEERVQLLPESDLTSSTTSPWLKIHGRICCESWMAIKAEDEGMSINTEEMAIKGEEEVMAIKEEKGDGY